jgi:hypothetical protein
LSCGHSNRMVSSCRFYVSRVCVTIKTIHIAGLNLIRDVFSRLDLPPCTAPTS